MTKLALQSGNWSGVPNTFIDDWMDDLSNVAVRLYIMLGRMADERGVCWPSVPTLGQRLKRSRRAVFAGLKELATAGLLVRTSRRGRGHSNEYRVLDPPARPQKVQRGAPLDGEKGAAGCAQKVQRGALKGAAGCTHNKTHEQDPEAAADPAQTPEPPCQPEPSPMPNQRPAAAAAGGGDQDKNHNGNCRPDEMAGNDTGPKATDPAIAERRTVLVGIGVTAKSVLDALSASGLTLEVIRSTDRKENPHGDQVGNTITTLRGTVARLADQSEAGGEARSRHDEQDRAPKPLWHTPTKAREPEPTVQHREACYAGVAPEKFFDANHDPRPRSRRARGGMAC